MFSRSKNLLEKRKDWDRVLEIWIKAWFRGNSRTASFRYYYSIHHLGKASLHEWKKLSAQFNVKWLDFCFGYQLVDSWLTVPSTSVHLWEISFQQKSSNLSGNILQCQLPFNTVAVELQWDVRASWACYSDQQQPSASGATTTTSIIMCHYLRQHQQQKVGKHKQRLKN